MREILAAAALSALSTVGLAQTVQPLNKLESVHPFGIPGEMTCNSDGSILWASEGGTIAFLEEGPTTGASPFDLVKVKDNAQVGSLGVWGCDMILDPDANVLSTTNPPPPNSFLYIAGGRHGLWAMQADPRDGVDNLAILIDDAGKDRNVSEQGSRRWCNSVDVLEIEINGQSKKYLVALFAKKGANRVRIYPLDMVRAALNAAIASTSPTRETDHVILPDTPGVRSIRLKSNSAVPAPGSLPPYEVDFAYGTGLDVDNSDPLQPVVYVALGMHGLIRLVITESDLLPPTPTTTPTDPIVEPGPFFGDDSHYYTIDPEVYGHFVLYEENPGPNADPVHKERPVFSDVAVGTSFGATFVYAAVDHLGWIRFTGSPWGPGLPAGQPAATIRHHEGIKTDFQDTGWGAPPTYGAALDPGQTTYAHRIEVISVQESEAPSPITSDSVVLLAASKKPYRDWIGTVNEGRALDYTGSKLGKIDDSVLKGYQSAGSEVFTFIYREWDGTEWLNGGLSTSNQATYDYLFHSGGFYTHAPPVQRDLNVLDRTSVFIAEMIDSGSTLESFSLSKVEVDWATTSNNNPGSGYTPPGFDEYQLLTDERPGRWCWDVATLLPDPSTAVAEEEFLVTSGNDKGLAPTNPLYFEGSEIKELPDTEFEFANPLEGVGRVDTFGIVFSETSQWLADYTNLAPGYEYTVDADGGLEHWVLGVGRVSGVSMFMLRRIEVRPLSHQEPALRVAEEYFFRAAPDKYFQREAYFGRGHVAVELDLLDLEGREYITLAQAGFYEGVVLIDRAHLVDELRASEPAPRDGFHAELSTDFLDASIDPPVFEPLLGERLPLPTPVHREMTGVYEDASLTSISLSDASELRLGAMGGSMPRFFELPGDPTVAETVLAVPGWTLVADPMHPLLTGRNMGPPWDTYHSHLFVRFYSVQWNSGSNLLELGNLPTFFGPDSDSMVQRIEVLDLADANGDEELFLVAMDFDGSLVVHALDELRDTDLSGVSQPADVAVVNEFARWDFQESVTDSLNQNVYGLTVQRVGERALLYVSVWRLGVRVIEFDPFDRINATGVLDDIGDGSVWYDHGLIQTTYNASSSVVREATDSVPARLLVPDGSIGIRSYVVQ